MVAVYEIPSIVHTSSNTVLLLPISDRRLGDVFVC